MIYIISTDLCRTCKLIEIDLVAVHLSVDERARERAPPRQAVKLPLNWNTVRKRDNTHSPTPEYSVPNTHQSPVNLHLVYLVKCHKYSYSKLLQFAVYRLQTVYKSQSN